MPNESEIDAAAKIIAEAMLPFRARDGWDGIAKDVLVAAERVRNGKAIDETVDRAR